ncbi:MAG: DUF4238 domain-containing protein [Xanthomonadales bacterium]|nr:DUF4238 domain-containing protein [Xanthomonadales bacterium]
MATNKNQHFVPRCYLKAFSKDGEGLAINLFNIGRKRLIQNAPLKHQCSKNHDRAGRYQSVKAFSKDGEGLAINLFNIGRRRLIQNAPLKHQCSKNHDRTGRYQSVLDKS